MKEKYKNPHPVFSPEWYEATFQCLEHCHQQIFYEIRNRWWSIIDSVLEVGCGTFDFYPTAFAEKDYTGCDINPNVIAYCKKNYDAKFPHHLWKNRSICDFPDESFDFVYSHAVIDHAKDPIKFIDDCLRVAKRLTYIVSYRGFFPDMNEHRQEKAEDGFFYNDISVRRVIRQLTGRADVFWFDILPLHTARPPIEIQHETVIKILKRDQKQG